MSCHFKKVIDFSYEIWNTVYMEMNNVGNVQAQVEQSDLQSQSLPVNPKNKTKSVFLVVFVLLGFILFGGGGYYLGTKNAQQTQPTQPNDQNQNYPSPTTTVFQPSSTQTPIINIKTGYPKRQFDPTKKFFSSRDYPNEVTSIVDTELVGMRCTARLTCVSPYTECTYYPEGADTSKPPSRNTDPQLLNLIKEANKTIDKETVMGIPARDIEEVTLCDTEDGRQILRYKTGGGGGGAGSVDYIGLGNSGNVINKIVAIQENIAYFGCYQPLQLAKSNILYYQCGGGDGPAGSSTIYKINLTNKTSSSLLQCTSVGDESGNVTLTCK